MSQLLDLTVDVSYTLYITDELPFSSDDGRTFALIFNYLSRCKKDWLQFLFLSLPPLKIMQHYWCNTALC